MLSSPGCADSQGGGISRFSFDFVVSVINFPQRPERMFSILYSLCFLCNERKEHLTGFDHILELELLSSDFAPSSALHVQTN